VVGILLLKPDMRFAASCIEFEVFLGIEWALTAPSLRKYGTFDALGG